LGEVCELPADEPGHVYHVFVVRSPERDRISEHLASAGIASAAYYETPLHLQPALRFLGHSEGDFPETERASRENLALPMWAGIGADVQEQVVAAVREAVSLEAVR
jgi:dTDP-4-amino-4,6-dideoxygalactose transaminase